MIMDTGDTGFIMISTALVFLMTPGLALFYGGMVRKKNVLSTLMHSWVIIGIMSLQWILVGYTLAFGPDLHGLIGGLDGVGLNGVGMVPNPDYAATIPAIVFMAFQMMFAVITPALISGSIAERMNFPAFIVFILLWATFVYDPLAHWVWGIGGFLRTLGALDFAGGNVVHISSGYSALIAALVLGKRKGFGKDSMAPHHVPMTVLGAGLLWFGWYGFNAGSALGANGLAANAFVVTTLAGAMGALTWMTVSWIRHGQPSVLGAAVGAIAGLVGITPAAGFVSPASAIVIGFGAGFLCFFAVDLLKEGAGIDDALDVFAVHGVGGIWGALATGIFAKQSINGIGADGLLYGNAEQLLKQAVAVVAVVVYVAVASIVILKVIDIFVGLRVPEGEEVLGLDTSQHGEIAYQV